MAEEEQEQKEDNEIKENKEWGLKDEKNSIELHEDQRNREFEKQGLNTPSDGVYEDDGWIEGDEEEKQKSLEYYLNKQENAVSFEPRNNNQNNNNNNDNDVINENLSTTIYQLQKYNLKCYEFLIAEKHEYKFCLLDSKPVTQSMT